MTHVIGLTQVVFPSWSGGNLTRNPPPNTDLHYLMCQRHPPCGCRYRARRMTINLSTLDNGKNGNYYSMLGLYRENGKENGDYS